MPTVAELRRLAGCHPGQLAEAAWLEAVAWVRDWGADGRHPRQNAPQSRQDAPGPGQPGLEPYECPRTGKIAWRPCYAPSWEGSHGMRADGALCAYESSDALYRYVRGATGGRGPVSGPPLPDRTQRALAAVGDGDRLTGLRRIEETQGNARESGYLRREFCAAWSAE